MSYVNDLYPYVFDAVIKKEPFDYFNRQYKYFGGVIDHGRKHVAWLDYLLDRYLHYRSCSFNKEESEVSSILDGLEALISTPQNNNLQEE